jgi:gliding motility-associated-like protein
MCMSLKTNNLLLIEIEDTFFDVLYFKFMKNTEGYAFVFDGSKIVFFQTNLLFDSKMCGGAEILIYFVNKFPANMLIFGNAIKFLNSDKNYHVIMKAVLLLIILTLAFQQTVLCQINLVPNPSFDSVDCRSQRISKWTQIGFSFPCHECLPLGASPGPNYKTPFISPSPWGGYSECYQLPLTGKGFAAVEVSKGRGALIATLKEELKQYKTYFARFFVTPFYPKYDWIQWAYNGDIGMLVTDFDNSIFGGDFPYFNEKPVIENGGKLLKDTSNWVKVSGSFNARGREKYVVLGNFKTNENTKVDLNGYVPKTGSYAPNIFFIDDVLISEFDPLPDTAILCADAPLKFDATFYDAKYRWSDWSENSNLEITKPGSYWVQARIDGVLLQDEVLVIAEKEFEPLPKDTVVCDRGPSVRLSINAKAEYKWSTGETTNSILLNRGGIYSVTVTTPQCALKFSTSVKARNCFCDFYAPNIFSPNDDGQNDVFKPNIDCKVIYISDYKFSVFNRFGNLVFTTTDINSGWDGTYNGQKCSQDVFAWYVEYNTLIDKDLPYRKVVESGDVTLMK